MKCRVLKINAEDHYIPKFEDFLNSVEVQGRTVASIISNHFSKTYSWILTEDNYLYRSDGSNFNWLGLLKPSLQQITE